MKPLLTLSLWLTSLRTTVLNSLNFRQSLSVAVEYLGFKFDKSDGEALINIMEKYKDD